MLRQNNMAFYSSERKKIIERVVTILLALPYNILKDIRRKLEQRLNVAG